MSIAEELERLDALRREGALSDEEFAAAKRQLLGLDAGPRSRSRAPSWSGSGRIPLAASSGVMLLALALPWIDLGLVRFSALEFFGFVFRASGALRELSGAFGLPADAIDRTELAAVAFLVVVAVGVTSPLWSDDRIRNRHALVGSALVVAVYAVAVVRYSANSFLAVGAYVFLLGSLTNAAVAGSILMDRVLSRSTEEDEPDAADEQPTKPSAATAPETIPHPLAIEGDADDLGADEERPLLVGWIEANPGRLAAGFAGLVLAAVALIILLLLVTG